MKKLASKKTKPLEGNACQHKGCPIRHKSPSGYCYEHASDMDSKQAKPRFTFKEPLLWEEREARGITPKVTIK